MLVKSTTSYILTFPYIFSGGIRRESNVVHIKPLRKVGLSQTVYHYLGESISPIGGLVILVELYSLET